MSSSQEKHKIRELKKKYSVGCLYGRCEHCSRVVDGKGIHDVEVYQVFECEENIKCDHCEGKGYVENTCPNCDGLGVVDERCEVCNGKGKLPDECGDKTLIKEEVELIRVDDGKP